MKKGDLIKLKVEKYAFEGKGIAKISDNELLNNKPDNFVVFVKGAYPGDLVNAKIKKLKKSFAEAVINDVLESSGFRVDARCKYFRTCGGCKQQDLDYKYQLMFKEQQVKEIFEHTGGLSGFEIEKIVPSENIFFYRNKMEYSFSGLRWLTEDEISISDKIDRSFALGLHVPRIFDKVLDIDECFLQSEKSNKILNATRSFFKVRKTSIYSTKTHEGFLRNLVIRQSAHTNDLMVNLVTSSEDEQLMKEFTGFLTETVPEITTVINNVNLKKASVAVGDYQKVFYGSGFIFDKIGDYKFRISANSFFQTNTLQAEKLYAVAAEFADFKGDEIVYDLYSGAGTIAIYISKLVKEVYGFESVQSSVFDAKENSLLNDVENVHFIEADLYKSFIPQVEENKIPKPDVIILDPPRSGMHKNTVSDVIKLSPQKIVYVSCNPVTQVRDIKMLVEAGYKLIKIRTVDMFPHTYHIENVALLRK